MGDGDTLAIPILAQPSAVKSQGGPPQKELVVGIFEGLVTFGIWEGGQGAGLVLARIAAPAYSRGEGPSAGRMEGRRGMG